MLRYTGLFLVFALIAANFGFGVVGGFNWLGARIAFFACLAISALLLVGSTLRGRPASPETARRRRALDAARSAEPRWPTTHPNP